MKPQSIQYDREDIILNGFVFIRKPDGTATTNFPQILSKHSYGLEWGYGGSGCADAALNVLYICMEIYGIGSREFRLNLASELYQDFKWKFIATMPECGGVIPLKAVLDYIKRHFESEPT